MEHKLLIVDDEPNIYHALRRAMHREPNWKTLYADGGEQALEILGTEHVDIVICDENMPGMNGTQLLGIVRQRWPDIIRMMLTGDARVDVIMNAVNRGEIYRFFTKPANEAEVIIAIRDALAMSRLKQESRRLLETVKSQAARLRQLEGSHADSGADLLAAGPEKSRGVVSPRPGSSMNLDDMSSRGGAGSSEVRDGVIRLGGDGMEDVDSLLEEIRTELDRLV